MAGTKLYRVWDAMKDRCYRESHKVYRRYGGRGILVCDEWKTDFIVFKNWALENGYKASLTIDRIDNDKGYFPSNCHFVSQAENCRNRKGIKLNWANVHEIRRLSNNNLMRPTEIAKKFNITYNTVWEIVNNKKWVR